MKATISRLFSIGVLFMLLSGCGVSKNAHMTNPVHPAPFVKAVSFCNAVTKTQTSYNISTEKVNNLGKVLSANPALPKVAANGCNGWWINFNSKDVVIRKILGVDINKAVAVRINKSYLKAISQNTQP
jgi:hypothetical protein